jgi:hypothetical protein
MVNAPRVAAFGLAMWLVCSFAVAAPTVTVRTNPERIIGGGVSVIAIRVTDAGQPVANQAVKIAVVEGQECGTPQSTTATTGEDGTIPRVHFTGGLYVEACVAQIEVTTETPPATEGGPPQIARAQATVTVNPNSGAMTRVDGFSAIALVLVVSFAIDRLVRGLLFVLSYSSAWSRQFPDPAFNNGPISAEAERNRRLIYFVLAGSLGMIALGWVGQVRILSALGFTNVNRWLDILVTGLSWQGALSAPSRFSRALVHPDRRQKTRPRSRSKSGESSRSKEKARRQLWDLSANRCRCPWRTGVVRRLVSDRLPLSLQISLASVRPRRADQRGEVCPILDPPWHPHARL